MNCPVREEDLALYLTGDLDAEIDIAVSAHLECCAACRATMTDFRVAAHMLAAAFESPRQDEACLSVRAARRKPRRSLSWAMAASVAAVFAAAFYWPRYAGVPIIQETELIAPVPDFPWAFPNLHYRTRRPVVEAGLRSVSLATTSSGSAELRITTADPDVVILLPMDDTTHAN